MSKLAIITAAYETQDEEWIYPYYRLLEAGYTVHLVKPHDMIKPEIGKYGIKIPFTHSSKEIQDFNYDIFIASGGWGAELVRNDIYIQKQLIKMNTLEKTIGAICHGPWVLISAGIVNNRKLTCFHGMKDDIINAGGIYLDREVLRDNNIITSPHYKYNHLFMREILGS